MGDPNTPLCLLRRCGCPPRHRPISCGAWSQQGAMGCSCGAGGGTPPPPPWRPPLTPVSQRPGSLGGGGECWVVAGGAPRHLGPWVGGCWVNGWGSAGSLGGGCLGPWVVGGSVIGWGAPGCLGPWVVCGWVIGWGTPRHLGPQKSPGQLRGPWMPESPQPLSPHSSPSSPPPPAPPGLCRGAAEWAGPFARDPHLPRGRPRETSACLL